MRNNNTFQSNVFGDSTTGGGNVRESNTFKGSDIFGAAVQDKSGRKRLGGESKGTATLFGDAAPDYVKTSTNGMIQAPKAVHRPE